MGKDMRLYLKELEEAGELLHLTQEVDPLKNLGGIAYQVAGQAGKASLFENLKGLPGWRAVSYINGSRRRLAVGMHTTPQGFIPHLRGLMAGGLTPLKMVDDGPVQEVVWTGDEVDLRKIPIHHMADADAGPYIGSDLAIVKDPEKGFHNVSLHRLQLQGKQQLGIMMSPTRHMHMIYEKYEAMNKPMPIAIAIGHHPAYYIAANWTTAFGVDELEIAGTLMGEPVEMVRCKTIDLEAPAWAEIVIEGEIPPHERHMEGPFTEHTGLARMGNGMNPFIRIKAITMRHDAIYYALQGGRPIAESQVLDGLPMEVVLFERIKDVGGFVDLKDVVCPPYVGGCHVVFIQLTPTVEGQVNDALMAALSSPYIHPRIVIAVDDDVDPHDPQQVFWSLSTRCNPIDDIFIVKNTKGLLLDPTAKLLTPPGVFPQIRLGSKMGIDATKPPLRDKERREEQRISIPMGMDKFNWRDFID
ncbi:MAG: UbiD family decarboxylase [Actinobacteria bacterium]|nr:UbiD family decarboxylase [Actinomycetota bacterium]